MLKANNIFVQFWDSIKEYIIYPFSHIRFIDIIDILLLMFIFYAFYHFIKNRRAGKLMIGLVVIIAMIVISTVFEMHALQFLADTLHY